MKHMRAYHKIVKSGSAFFISSSIVSVLAYAFHIFAARFLSVSEYGTLQAVLSLQNIGLVPVMILIAFFTRIFAEHKGDDAKDKSFYVRNYVRRVALFPGAIIFALSAFVIPFLQDFFNIPSFAVFILLWLTLYFSIFQSIDNSLLNGWHRFMSSNLGTVSNGVSKFIIGVMCMALGWGVFGGLVGVASGFLINSFLNAISVSHYFKKNTGEKGRENKIFSTQKIEKNLVSAYPVIMGVVAITIFSNVDILIAKHHFTSEIAGNYSGIFVLSKVIFFAVSSLATVVIPLVSAEKNYQKKRQYLLLILLADVIIAGIGVLIFYFFPMFIITMLFGSDYLTIAPYLAQYGLLALLLSTMNIIVQYCISMRYHHALFFMIVLAGCEVFLLWVYGHTFEQFFMIIFVLLVVGNIFGGLSLFTKETNGHRGKTAQLKDRK